MRHEVATLLAAPAAPATRDDPYPAYARLRALGPPLTAPDGVLVVTGHREVGSVARDPRLRKNPGPVSVAAVPAV